MQRRIATKWQLVGFGWLCAALLAFYTLGALWEYANSLQSSNGWMLKVGFTACEASIFVWVWWHVFRNWVVTRVWCLIAATAMGVFLVVHSSAVAKYTAAKTEGAILLGQLSEGQAKIAEATARGAQVGAGEGAAKLKQAGGTRREVAGAIRSGANVSAQVGAEGQKVLADATAKMEEQAKNSTFLSAEYLNGKMFAVVFTALLGLVFITFIVFELGKAEEDDDNDGIPNYADLDSPYYNAQRAEKWYTARGETAPHLLQPRTEGLESERLQKLIQREVDGLADRVLRESKPVSGFSPRRPLQGPVPVVKRNQGAENVKPGNQDGDSDPKGQPPKTS